MILQLIVPLMLLTHLTSAEWVNVTDVREVEENGILAGTNRGADVYVGKMITAEGISKIGALYLRSSSDGGPVLKYPSAGAHNETKGLQYLKKEDNCRYVWERSGRGAIVPEAIEVPYLNMSVHIGKLDRHNGMQVGPIFLQSVNILFYAHDDKELYAIQFYQVLTCKPNASTTTKTK